MTFDVYLILPSCRLVTVFRLHSFSYACLSNGLSVVLNRQHFHQRKQLMGACLQVRVVHHCGTTNKQCGSIPSVLISVIIPG